MIDIIGFLKIDESKPERIDYLIACIRSYGFLFSQDIFAYPATITIALDNPSDALSELVNKEVMNLGFKEDHANVITVTHNPPKSYGSTYSKLIRRFSKNEFIINFMEDQFMVIPTATMLNVVLQEMKKYKADVCKSTFFDIENNCLKYLNSNTNSQKPAFLNSPEAFTLYQVPYTKRYWLGVNFITTRLFAEKFWGRDCGLRPHDYELEHYDENYLHTVLIPHVEIQAAIDDNHGEPNTCLLSRSNKKFYNIMQSINVSPELIGLLAPAEVVEEVKDEIPKSWLTKDAWDFLNAFINFHNRIKQKSSVYGLSVLQFGMGETTIWLANQHCVVYLASIEHIQMRYEAVCEQITKSPAGYFGRHDIPYNNMANQYSNNFFDLIMVDATDTIRCIQTSMSKLRPGGIFVVETTDELLSNELNTLLIDYTRIECTKNDPDPNAQYYAGLKTTIYIKIK